MTRRQSVEVSATTTAKEYAASLLVEGMKKIDERGWWGGDKGPQTTGAICAALSIDFSIDREFEAEHGMIGYHIAIRALAEEIPPDFTFKASDIGDGHYTTSTESQRYAKVTVYNDAADEGTVRAWMERALARVKETNE